MFLWSYSFVKVLKGIIDLNLFIVLIQNRKFALTELKQFLVAPKSTKTSIWVPYFSLYVIHLPFAFLPFLFSFKLLCFLFMSILNLKNSDLLFCFTKLFALNWLFWNVTIDWFLFDGSFFLLFEVYETLYFLSQNFFNGRTYQRKSLLDKMGLKLFFCFLFEDFRW